MRGKKGRTRISDRGAVLVLVLGLMALPLRAEEMTRSPVPPPNPAHALSEAAGPATLPDAAAATLPDAAAQSDGAAQPDAPALPDAPAQPDAAETPPAATLTLRPRPRPAALEARIAAARAAAAAPAGPAGGLDLLGLRPKPRPDDLAAAPEAAPEATPEAGPDAMPAPKGKKKKKKDKASAKGSVCGVAAIKGEKIAPIRSKVKGCGLKDGVRVTSVSGVRLSPAITVDCATATALNRWIDDVVQPAYGHDVVEVRVAAHYICRSRNNKKGAKISEHGRGKAVDVAGFVLSGGKLVTVVSNYNKTLRRVHKQACGLFGTTLGPGSDGYHEDHLHLDTASHRSGAYCR